MPETAPTHHPPPAGAIEARPRLDYAPPKPHRRRRLVRGLALLLLAVAAVAVGWRWGPAAWRRAELLYWQRQCLAYTAPPAQVVYEEDPARVQALLADGWYVQFRYFRV